MDNNFQVTDLVGLHFIDDTGFRLEKKEIDRIRKRMPNDMPFNVRYDPEIELVRVFICKQINQLTGTYAVYPPFVLYAYDTTFKYFTTEGSFTITLNQQTGKPYRIEYKPNEQLPQEFIEKKMLALAEQHLNQYIPLDITKH